ncbi:MAG: hypothetical protein QW751_00980 [Candidatus Aenigmatarchaeota archaeon]|nr:hypothetical protein [Candidatus Aenigmarchaeota archaeon]
MKIEMLRKKDKLVREAAAALNCEPEALPSIIEKFQREIRDIKKEMKRIRG